MPEDVTRCYVSLKVVDELFKMHLTNASDPEAASRQINAYVDGVLKKAGVAASILDVVQLPTLRRMLEGPGQNDAFTATVETNWDYEQFEQAVNASSDILNVGIDQAIFGTHHWRASNSGLFGDRVAAERLIGADELRASGLTGSGVNVALFDHGFDKRLIPAANFGGGLAGMAGMGGGGHGLMIVRQILSLAPDALIYDYPVLPDRISNLSGFIAGVDDAYRRFLNIDFPNYVLGGRTGPWIAVNAWSVFDCRPGSVAYRKINDPTSAFNRLLGDVAAKNIDIVFAAGNCGQFCPDGRCGGLNREPGASVIGPNSHPGALTVGAVRTDGLWAGYSSQGPGQPLMADEKPDLSAPSSFREFNDPTTPNDGTSAACGIVAGVVAAIRQGWPHLPPAALRTVLRDTARRMDEANWNPRSGCGVINAAAALDALALPPIA